MSKRKFHAALCTVMGCTMLLSISLNALSYTGLGTVVKLERDTVGNGLYYSEFESVTEEDKKQHAYIFEYDYRMGGVLPVVRFGESVYGKDRVGSLVKTETNEGKAVLGAINGDFYSMQTGVPMGVMIDGGKLITSDDGMYALGFLENGSAIIGKPEIKISITNLSSGSEPKKIHHLNKYPTVWGAYLLTEDFSDTTKLQGESTEIVIRLDGIIKASGSVKGEVIEVINGAGNSEIPDGCAVLSISKEYADYGLYSGFKKGDLIRIDSECAALWEQITSAVGGGDLILEAGNIPEGIAEEDHEKTVNPRTAVGLKPDGNVVFFAVDGRSQDSRGLKLTDLSAVMAELGCTYALNLDGGGSTTVMVKPSGDSETVYVNTSSDTGYRSVANGILFLSTGEADGIPAALKISPNTPLILRGSTIDFTAEALDAAYQLITDTEIDPASLTAAFTEEYEDAGYTRGNSYTAGLTGGEYRLRVTNGDISGDVSVIVADTLDELYVSPESVQIKPGTLLPINITAVHEGKPIHFDAGSFYYTLNGTHILPNPDTYPDAMIVCDLGYLDKQGNFRAFDGDIEGEVEIGVWFDEFVRYVKVKISDETVILSDFEEESELDGFIGNADHGELQISLSEHGFKSSHGLKVDFTYDTESDNKVMAIKLAEKITLSRDTHSIKMWIYGYTDGELTALASDAEGNVYELPYIITKDYQKQLGWREITAEIPDSINAEILTLTELLSVSSSGSGAFSYVIDSPVIYYGRPSEPLLSGLTDHWAAEYLDTLYEMGVIQNYDCVIKDGEVYYSPDLALTRAEFAKILVLWSGTNAFPYINEGASLDMDTPIDKIPYIRAAIANGIMNGRGTLEDGTVVFDPNATITRQEAFKVIGSMLDAADTELTFTDAADIADWAREGVANCVASGIVSGYLDGTVRPTATISRSELSAVLAKLG